MLDNAWTTIWGACQNLTEGILRVRYRNSREKPELMKPGEVYKLRLEVSSSNFPRFDRNLNNGAELTDSGQADESHHRDLSR